MMIEKRRKTLLFVCHVLRDKKKNFKFQLNPNSMAQTRYYTTLRLRSTEVTKVYMEYVTIHNLFLFVLGSPEFILIF